MKLTRPTYTISRETLEKVLAALEAHRYDSDEDSEDWNVIEAQDELEKELKSSGDLGGANA